MTETTRELNLSSAQRELLWKVAQHKYGWTHILGTKRAAMQLHELGLGEYDSEREVLAATDSGKQWIGDLWPRSPFALGTYNTPVGGWDLCYPVEFEDYSKHLLAGGLVECLNVDGSVKHWIYLALNYEGWGHHTIVGQSVEGWSAGSVEAICGLENLEFLGEFLDDALSITLGHEAPRGFDALEKSEVPS